MPTSVAVPTQQTQRPALLAFQHRRSTLPIDITRRRLRIQLALSFDSISNDFECASLAILTRHGMQGERMYLTSLLCRNERARRCARQL